MPEKVLYKVGNVASELNEKDAGIVIQSDESWLTLEDVQRKYRDYHNMQEKWRVAGEDGKYFVSIIAVKKINVCPHCNEELDSTVQEIL